MTIARKDLVHLNETRYYHLSARCVRRAFLCGVDPLTNTNYEHRKQWFVERIRLLSSAYGIDIVGYSVMSNHYHLVVYINSWQIEALSDDEMLNRWCAVFKGKPIIQKYRNNEPLTELEEKLLAKELRYCRESLCSLSHFMKHLNQPISRRANKEDNCKGRFFEQRFHSEPILTDEQLLVASAYVDLNPVRAGLAISPESSDHTSIQERIRPTFNLDEAIANQSQTGFVQQDFSLTLKPLMPFKGEIDDKEAPCLPITRNSYLELVAYSGQAPRW